MTADGLRRSRARRRIVLAIIGLAIVTVIAPKVWASARDFYTKLQVLSTIVSLARDVYVDEVDPSDLMDGAISGLLGKLDPHSSYLAKDEAQRFTEKVQGSFSGVGIQYSVVEGVPTVIATIEGGPAEHAGVLAGDQIVRVDGQTTIGWRSDDVQSHLRGPKGTRVSISVSRAGVDDPIDIEITRGDIPLTSIPYAFTLNDSTAYVRITNFAATTAREFATAMDSLDRNGMRYLVIDLRNNAGGDMDGAVAIANHFLSDGSTIVSQRGRWEPANQVIYATGGARKYDVPVVVLINHGSASASEIVAGALQDTDRGIIVGQRSFGKGLVQRSFDLSSRVDGGGIVLLTVARYYTPTGRLIQRDYSAGTAQYILEGMTDHASIDTTTLPAFSTPAGRLVYGGGGISPDFEVDAQTVDRVIVRLANRSAFFRFADELARRNRISPETREAYRSSDIDDGLWSDFAEFAMSTDTTLTEDDLERVRTDATPYVLAGIAGRFDGPEARYRLLLPIDTELAAALDHLNDAAELRRAGNARENRHE